VASGLSSVVAGIAGCAAPPPPEVPPPPPPPPAPQVVAAPEPKPGELVDPAGATKGLGAFSPVFEGSWGKARPLPPTSVVAFGKGSMAYLDMTDHPVAREPACLVAGVSREDCQFLRVAPWEGQLPAGAWRNANPGSGTGAWSRLIPARRRWGNLSPGQDVVYAIRREGALTIDTINERGEIATLLEGGASGSLSDVKIVELGGNGLVAVGRNEEGSIDAVELVRSGATAKVGQRHPLKISPLDPTDPAAYARSRISSGDKVSFGDWVVSPMLDKSGALEPSWLFAWVEAQPPPKYTPAGAPYKGPRVRPKGKHGCGRSSRPLIDASVEKQTHLMRMSPQGAILEDKTVKVMPMASEASEGSVLSVVLFPGGIEVNGHRFDNKLTPERGDAQPAFASLGLVRPPFEGTLPPSIIAAGYDAASGEGVVVGAQGENYGAQIFDGVGNAKGEPFLIPGHPRLASRSLPAVARAGGTWVALESNGNTLLILNGANAGKTISVSADSAYGRSSQTLAVLPVDDNQVQVVAATWSTPRELMVVKVDVPNRTATSVVSANARVHIANDSEAVHVMSGPGADGTLTFLGRRPNGTPMLGRLDPSGKWSDVSLKIGEEIGDVKRVRAHEVWKDSVLVVEGETSALGVWASSAQIAPLPSLGGFDKDDAKKRVDREREAGPLLLGATWMVDGAPGDVVAPDAALAKSFAGCPYAFPTGPRRVLMVCAEPTETDKLGARVGLRVLRY
jgi:hypothetical protein